jgi:hypothetical protein
VLSDQGMLLVIHGLTRDRDAPMTPAGFRKTLARIGELRDPALVRDDVADGLLSTEVSRSTAA